jgi:hypothetical protein
MLQRGGRMNGRRVWRQMMQAGDVIEERGVSRYYGGEE